jgi:hypothetical protein
MISVGSDSTYKIVAADKGHRLTCAVIVTDSNGSARATSASVAIAAPKLPVVRATFTPYWNVTGTTTTLASIKWIRPQRAHLKVRCRGSGCPSGVWVGSARHIGRLVHAYNGYRLHPGAVVIFIVSLSGHRPERITFTIRNGQVPKVTVHS